MPRIITMNNYKAILNMGTAFDHGKLSVHRVAHQDKLARGWFRHVPVGLDEDFLAIVEGRQHGFSSNPKPLESSKTPEQKPPRV